MDNEQIKKILEDVLQKMGVQYDSVELEDNGFNTTFQIKTDDAAVLIGTGGETLDALSYIVRRMVQKTQDDITLKTVFIVDVNHYQSKKLDEFRARLQTSADRVRLFKEPIELSPMTSYERMIVHSTFTDDKEITTGSVGEGKVRHIVLRHAEASQETEAPTSEE